MFHKMKTIAVSAAMLGTMIVPMMAAAQPAEPIGQLGLEFQSNIGIGTADIRDTIASIINVAMGLLGTIAVVIILFGGFKWMTSSGEKEKVEEARKLIIAGVVGLVIILSAYAIAQFVISSLLKGTGVPS